MTDQPLPTGHPQGPLEEQVASVSLLGDPYQGWALEYDLDTLRLFANTTFASVSESTPEPTDGQNFVRFDLHLPLGYLHQSAMMLARICFPRGIFGRAFITFSNGWGDNWFNKGYRSVHFVVALTVPTC